MTENGFYVIYAQQEVRNVILGTRWNSATWPVMRGDLKKALAIRSALARGREWN